jgi:hypothetical protein
MSTTEELDAMLDLAEAAIHDAQQFEHEHGLTSSRTRKLPADLLRTLHRWQKVNDAAVMTAALCDKSRATAPTDSGQPTAGDQVHHIVCEESPTVPTGPATSVRIPTELREQAEAFGRERRWTFGEVVRVGLEQLVGYDHELERQTHTKKENAQ